MYEGRGPGKRMPPGPPKVPLCCTLLENIFRNVTKDASECGRCFCCDGGISSYALELVPFIRGELQLPLGIKCAAHSPLGYSVGCFNPILRGTKEEDVMGLVPVARTTLLINHIRSGIRLDLSAPISTRRDG